ncbi:peptidoglycan DD-metalloendopeptidase family protein [Aliiglaciecola sp. LCG003]|uniref:murein hydrolase activator EnvC family protein n=1 Tax=Aliiglaciecola sp. LCG003 TaxID=3053655 RepID=UPI0025732B70|nr:peptidoglycan DD-metalloendopeptidase family protein [Aliiglaciecola sp. LCG003]WJG10036.1 peptidoglycan DD-metalloendopeptidase family protein [Aliiglaciecola sp. LCG003]
MHQFVKYIKLALCFAALVLCGTVVAQQTDELKQIQQEIKHKQQQIDQQLAEAKQLQQQLKAAELNIARTAKSLDETKRDLAANVAQQTALKAEQTELRKKQQQQQQALAKQLKSMYMAGDYDFAKMIFNLEDASKFERTFSYYQYLTEARKQQIDQFRQLVEQLRQVNESLADKQQQLESLQLVQQQQSEQLVQQQHMRKKTLAKITQRIDTEAVKIEQLQINEQALLKAIEEAERAAQQRPVSLNGLANLEGKLINPTQGKMRNMFGRIRQGQIKWKGVLFNGNTGAPVRAVYDGKVLYADWLRGLGLVTVVDHGDGYMSLYGHNQALLKQVGDDVQSGDTIALVGQSGGQTAPNLYFEIRHKGTPVNPTKWLKP